MPFKSTKEKLHLSQQEIVHLKTIAASRTESLCRVERAKMLLRYYNGDSISVIAKTLKTNRPKVQRCIDKALEFGIEVALNDLARSGKPPKITDEAKAWVISCACQKPKDLGYSYEIWTNRLLAQHIRNHCLEQGYPCLQNLARGTVSKLLSEDDIKPHKVRYYLERRDPEFDNKMAQVLCVYKEVHLISQTSGNSNHAFVSYDEKPGLQAIENTAPDLPPSPGKYPYLSRDHEYIRHGTLSILAGIDLLTGHILATIEERHRSQEFIAFLKTMDDYYKDKEKIKIVLDNHSAHISKETRDYLATKPNRFEFIFTPKHGSWLNIIESFFGKMARTVLREIRVSSIAELKARLFQYIEEINETPVIFRWKYKVMEEPIL